MPPKKSFRITQQRTTQTLDHDRRRTSPTHPPIAPSKGKVHFLPTDDLGLDGYLSQGATRLASLCGLQKSFAQTEVLLRELCGWELDDETIRKATHTTARQAQASRPTRTDAERFSQAPGVVEVPIDAGKVNTPEGWRDIKIAVISKRKPGEPATPQEWDERELPKPSAQSVVAAIEDCHAFGERVRTETKRLKVSEKTPATVLADGAEWIWNLAAMVLPFADGVLDIYHALEHLGDAVKAIWGDSDQTIVRRQQGGDILLSQGKAGIETWIGQMILEVPDGKSSDPLLDLAAYLAKHPSHLGYRDRLASGQSIGSGQVEGAVKQLVNLRLKRTGARWCVKHVGPLVELLAMSHDTKTWNEFWLAA